MKKALTLALLLFVAVAALAGEGGRVYSIVGTVKSLQENEALVTLENGKEATVTFTDQTEFRRAGTIVTKDELKEGAFISVETARDGQTAVFVKITRARK